ncbi:hypothetical protein [Streptomyces sp. NPDC051572]|uniref:hypothetical protein n=1 Tax=Streptomyces sp. NPDC051572 TaxID=3155802 RepID=UPI00344E570B
MLPQSGPHGEATLHTGSGSATIAQTTVPSTARTDHSGLAQAAGRFLAHCATSADRQAVTSGGRELDGIGTGVSGT